MTPQRHQDLALRAVFRDWFGVTAGEADVLAVLYQAGGVTRPQDMIARMTGLRAGYVPVAINTLRQSLDTEAIDFIREAGYCLTPIGLSECRAAIRQFTQTLGRCA